MIRTKLLSCAVVGPDAIPRRPLRCVSLAILLAWAVARPVSAQELKQVDFPAGEPDAIQFETSPIVQPLDPLRQPPAEPAPAAADAAPEVATDEQPDSPADEPAEAEAEQPTEAETDDPPPEPAPMPPVETPAVTPPPVSEAVRRREELNKQLESLQGLLEALDERKKQRTAEQEALEGEIEKFRRDGFAEPPPYALSRLDALRDQVETEVLAKQISEATLASKADAVEAARRQFETKETARRLAKEAAQTASDETNRAIRQEDAKLAELESQVAQTTMDLRKAEADDERQAVALYQKRLDFLEEQIASLKDQIHFSEAELNQRLEEVAQQEAETAATLHSVGLRQWVPDERWQEVREKLSATTDAKQREVLQEEAEAWRLARKQLQEEVLVLNRRLQLLAFIRQAWQRRYELYNDEPSPAEMSLWREETAAILKQLAGDAKVRAAQSEQTRNLFTTLQTRLEAASGESPERLRWLNDQQRHLTDMLRTYGRSITNIERGRRLHERLLLELNQGAESISLAQWAAGAYDGLLMVWNYELGVVDDRSITIRKIVSGILIVAIGFWAAQFTSRLVEYRLSKKNLINKDSAAVFRTLLFYSMLVLIILIALWSVNVPVTVFTFLGGALAIGFGLGSQNLVNNFLSGLVIITERPVRMGERIVFGGYDGMVEEVGYRCTKLRTLTGHLVTIPNSHLINEQVENVQRRPYIRRSINVTIPYGTTRLKVQEAVETLKAILDEEGIREPIHPTIAGDYLEPRVHFSDYNPASLNIWVIYWYSPPWFWDYMEHTERVNFRIMEEFERIGVEFAVPTQKVFVEHENPPIPEPR